MATILPIGIGFVPNDGTGDTIRDAFDKCNQNFNALNITSENTMTQEVKAAVALTKGQAVYISGATSGTALVSKASNVSDAFSNKTLGLITTTLAINDIGSVITEGILSGLNTSGATAGDPVWLGVNGALLYGIANKPLSPNNLVLIGYVLRVSSSNGSIYVKVKVGFELEELDNVLITSALDNQSIFYESGTGLWKNKDFATINGNSIVGGGDISTGSVTSGGSANYIAKFDNSTNIVDSPLYVDTPNVGLGTNFMTAKFDILGDGSSGDSLMALRNNDSFDLFRVVTDFDSQNFEVKFGEVGQQFNLPYFKMDQTTSYFDKTWLGIGQTNPSCALDVAGDIKSNSVIYDGYGGSSTYWNGKQDALVSGTNIKTINSVSVLGSGNLFVSSGVHSQVGLPSGQSIIPSINGTATTSATPTLNRIHLLPFIPSKTFTCASLYIACNGGAASALGRILIYSDSNGRPNGKLYESASLDFSTSGLKTATTTITFSAGVTYWIGTYFNSSGPLLGALNISNLTPISVAGGVTINTSLYNTVTFGSAPSTFGGTFTLASIATPYIGITA